jgi:hypothetical protein
VLQEQFDGFFRFQLASQSKRGFANGIDTIGEGALLQQDTSGKDVIALDGLMERAFSVLVLAVEVGAVIFEFLDEILELFPVILCLSSNEVVNCRGSITIQGINVCVVIDQKRANVERGVCSGTMKGCPTVSILKIKICFVFHEGFNELHVPE